MSFITVEHHNRYAVVKRLAILETIQRNNMVIDVINDKMDDLFATIYKVTPVRTGYLRSTLGIKGGDGFVQIMVTAYYAGYVEKGARGRPGRHFFFPNVANMVAEMIIAVRSLYMTIH